MGDINIQKAPFVWGLISALVLVLLPESLRSQPSEARGTFKWSADISWNLLTIQYDISNLSDQSKRDVIAWRFNTIRFFAKPNPPDQDLIFLMWRNIPSEALKGRATYEIFSSNTASFKGREVDLVVYQVTRRLLPETSPSQAYLEVVSGGVLDAEHTSPAPTLYFQPRPHESRLLAFTDSDTNNKTMTVPTSYLTYDAKDLVNFTMVFHLFTVTYWFATIYFVFLHPWFEHSRKSVRIFWASYYPMYFQFIVLFTQLSVWYYRQTDMVFSLLNMAHLRFFGLDWTTFTPYGDTKDRLSATLGKFATRYIRYKAPDGVNFQTEDPRIFCAMFPQTIIFLAAAIGSLATKDKMKESFVMMRLACTTCFGVQLCFRSTYSFQLLFSYGGTLGFLDYLSAGLGVIIVGLVLGDCAIMKQQARKLQDSSNAWTTVKAKGALYFDIMGFTGHKKYRDYYPFILGESEMVFAMAIAICIFGYNPIIQSIILLLMALLLFVSVVSLPQFSMMKILKLVLHVFILVQFVLNLICALTTTPDVSTARVLAQLVLINLFILLSWNLMFFIIRLNDLLKDSSSTYGENAKPVPPQKIKGPTSGTAKNPPMKPATNGPGGNNQFGGPNNQQGNPNNRPGQNAGPGPGNQNNGFGGPQNNQNPNMSGFGNNSKPMPPNNNGFGNNAPNQAGPNGFGNNPQNAGPNQNGFGNNGPNKGFGNPQTPGPSNFGNNGAPGGNNGGPGGNNNNLGNQNRNPYTGTGNRPQDLDNSRSNLMDQSMTNDGNSRPNNQVPTYNFGREFDNSSYRA